jgi:hypothetical protein
MGIMKIKSTAQKIDEIWVCWAIEEGEIFLGAVPANSIAYSKKSTIKSFMDRADYPALIYEDDNHLLYVYEDYHTKNNEYVLFAKIKLDFPNVLVEGFDLKNKSCQKWTAKSNNKLRGSK